MIYSFLDKDGAEEKEFVGEIVPFEKNQNIEEVQILLKLYGYDPGNADGVVGRRTRDCLERFQKDNGLAVTRKINTETLTKLMRFKNEGLIANNKLNTARVQTALVNAGFKPGKVDGKFGPKTLEAVKSFQKAHRLKVDGKVGYKTLSKLSNYLK